MAAVNIFNTEDLLAPAQHAAAVVPSDSSTLAFVTKQLYVGAAGNVTVIMADGTSVTYTAVPAGSYLRIRVAQVKATGTTATNLVAEW
jgi:hypothetical protein